MRHLDPTVRQRNLNVSSLLSSRVVIVATKNQNGLNSNLAFVLVKTVTVSFFPDGAAGLQHVDQKTLYSSYVTTILI